MILSMTGYGKAEESMNGVTVKVELRSLNNRYLDLNLRVSAFLREKEQEIRSVITDQLQRGKIDATVIWQSEAGAASTINRELLKAYYREIKSLAKELGESKKNLLALAFKMPDVMSPEKGSISEEEWELGKRVLNKALGDLVMFRTNEGRALEHSLDENVKRLLELLQEVEPHEKSRIENVKQRLHAQISENLASEEMDRNRLEQELIFYLERLDFSEEKVRLKSHCDFFLKTLDEKESNGRRLNFISQEMGREINTLGSKANHAGIQKIVVQMKDELEKIKEQLLNVL
ncbi:MAG: YicC family protein [Chitinophagales bacterium]|nr:YicC family protein [Chitinophagales bacterium]